MRTLVAGSLAFALVAAAASGTAFTVNTVQGVAVASAATGSLETHPCSGAYDIVWSVSSGEIVGVRAIRLPTSLIRDGGLEYCLDMPYAVLIAERDAVVRSDGSFDFTHDDWSVEWTGVTHPVTGSIDASSTLPASAPLVLSEGMAVQLAIGPDPLDPLDPFVTPVAGPPAPDASTASCEDAATGGVIEVVTVGVDDFCVHQFLLTGTATFEVVATSSLDVEYLVVGGGGGGAGTLGGGGGAGQVRTNVGTPLTLTAGEQPTVTVGAGGTGTDDQGRNGGSSSFGPTSGSIVAEGGFGGTPGVSGFFEPSAGGSGGRSVGVDADGSPFQFTGGAGSSAAGGGGAGTNVVGGAASDGPPPVGGAGGAGTITEITGARILVAAGGGGGSDGGTAGPGGASPDGGDPGGGDGSATCGRASSGRSPGSGGGGGGPGEFGCSGGDGAPGLVIVRYRAPS